MASNVPDEMLLKSWSFYKEYEREKTGLFVLADKAYCEVAKIIPVPTAEDCFSLMVVSLFHSRLFYDMLYRKPHLPPVLQETICRSLARFVLEKGWPDFCA